FDGYYSCVETVGFECFGEDIVGQKDSSCTAKLVALDDCQRRAKEATCEGVGADGECPTVDCACAGGALPVSGFQNDHETGTCRSLEATTCQEACGTVSFGRT